VFYLLFLILREGRRSFLEASRERRGRDGSPKSLVPLGEKKEGAVLFAKNSDGPHFGWKKSALKLSPLSSAGADGKRYSRDGERREQKGSKGNRPSIAP